MDLLAIFATGLFTGGLTCLAVQGGLLATTLAQRQEEHSPLPILSFLLAKLVAYTILGFLLGFFGSFFHLTITTQVILHFIIGIFMIGTALNILQFHPIFRYFVIQPPKFLQRLIRNQTKSKDIFAPAFVGFFTVFIPCGTTQAIMAQALGTASPLYSAAILFSFTLGTFPLFFTLGYLATKLTSVYQTSLMKAASYAVITLAIFNINNAVSLSGSKYTLSYLWHDFSCTVLSVCQKQVLAQTQTLPLKEATIYFSPDGYSPQSITVERNSQVKLNLVNNAGFGCVQAFTIPKLNVQKVVRQGTSSTLVFNTPNTPQDLRFTCSMGMFAGTIHVI